MFTYALRLAWIGLKRNRLLTALMILAIGLGVGAFMTTYNVYHMMSSDPIPSKSDQLFNLRLDILPEGSSDSPGAGSDGLPQMMTYKDSTALMEAGRGQRQVAHFATGAIIDSDRPDVSEFVELVRVTGRDFFAMFEVPFIHGGAWSENEAREAARVVVISEAMNERLFGGGGSVGETIRLDNEPYRVVGVIADWQPVPRYYDLVNGEFNDAEGLFIPIELTEPLELGPSGNVSCNSSPEPGFLGFIQSECVWANFWVELEDAAAVAEYRGFLEAYIAGQHEIGRFQNSQNYAMETVTEWMETRNVTGEDTPVILVASFLFLLVCLLNTVALLLAKYLSRSNELGVRRALGAGRGDIFGQHVVESALLGIAGGLLGLLLAWSGLRAVDALYSDMSKLVVMEWSVVGLAIAAAIVAAVLAGVYPAWRASNIAPAAQIRSQ